MKKLMSNDAPVRVVVIGGGPAGMLAAGTAASRGHDVVLLERNAATGKKLNITGKGRCNLTNRCPVEDVLANIPRNPRFLHSACAKFSPEDVIVFFESRGLKLKTERGNRVFPESDSAHDVTAALRGYLNDMHVKVVHTRATGISVTDGRVSGVDTQSGFFPCQRAVISTGGLSYPLTGSTGDGYSLAKACGHTIETPKASLVPLTAQQDFCAQMQGLSLRNVALEARDASDRVVFRDFGEMLFTHFGVSGPIILSASAHMRDMNSNKYHLLIDLKPGLDEKKLDARLLRDFNKYSNREFCNALPDLLHKSMIPVIISLSQIPPDTRVNSITREQRLRLLNLIKGLRIDISGTRPIEEAIVTSGGVSVREIDPKTMQSRLMPGLFFAGEVIDVDAYTGGFNLQIAWSTGYAAGSAV